MKYLWLYLLSFFAVASVQGQTTAWTRPATVCALAKPAGSLSNWIPKWEYTGGGSTGTSAGSFISGDSGADTRNYAIALANFNVTGGPPTSVRWVVQYQLGGELVPCYWVQCYPAGEVPATKHHGPVVDGVPQLPTGEPVDEFGEPPPEPDRHYASAEYNNPHPFPVTVAVTWDCEEEGIILQYTANVEPGASYQSHGYHDHPFEIIIQVTADGIPIGDPIVAPSEPVDPEDPEHPPQPADGQPGGVGGPPLAGGGQRPNSDGQVSTPAPVPDETRPGTPDGDEEARHKELRGEISRVAGQVKAAGDQAANDADRTNDLLSGIKDALSGDGDGDGPGDGLTQEQLEESLGIGAEEGPEPGEVGEAEDFKEDVEGTVGDIKTALEGLGTSMEGMIAAAGLDRSYTQSDWDYSLTLGQFGTFTVSFAEWTWIFDLLRQVTLALLGMHFLGLYIRTIRGAFV